MPPAQEIVFEAEVAAGPTVAVTAITADVEYETVHSSPDGSDPVGEVMDNDKVAVPPGGTVAEDRARASD